MDHAEIDLRILKNAVNAILDHLVNDLGIEKFTIDPNSDHYWHCPESELHDMSKIPIGLDIGSLTDDVHFVKMIIAGQSGDASLNLVHVVPLLRYLGEKIKK